MDFSLKVSDARRIISAEFERAGMPLRKGIYRCRLGLTDVVVEPEVNRTSGTNMLCRVGMDIARLDPIVAEIVSGVPTWPTRPPWYPHYKVGWSVGLCASDGERWADYFSKPFSVDAESKQWIMPDERHASAFVARLCKALTDKVLPEVSRHASLERVGAWFEREVRLDWNGPVEFAHALMELTFGDDAVGKRCIAAASKQYPFPPASQEIVAQRILAMHESGRLRNVRDLVRSAR